MIPIICIDINGTWMEMISLTLYWKINDTNEIRQSPLEEWERKYWLVIPKELYKLMMSREEYLGIDMVSKNWFIKRCCSKSLSCFEISKMKLFSITG